MLKIRVEKHQDNKYHFYEKIKVHSVGGSAEVEVESAVDRAVGIAYDEADKVVLGTFPWSDKDRIERVLRESFISFGYDVKKLVFFYSEEISDRDVKTLSSGPLSKRTDLLKALVATRKVKRK